MNRKKILYINYMVQSGHINFDNIQISALKSTGNEIRLIMPYQVVNKLGFPLSNYELVIPKILGIDSKFSIINRLVYIITLLYIKATVSFKRYDYVFISNLDELTLGIVPLCKRMYLFCHGNARDFESRLKKYFIKRLSTKNKFIVFNDDMKEPFNLNNIFNVSVVSHGCVNPFKQDINKLPINISQYNFVIFHPSSKIEDKFRQRLKGDTMFHEFLKKKNYALIVKDKKMEISNCPNIIVIHDYLTKEQYQSLFITSNVILLVYPESFKYQVSGISFECLANRKNILINNNPSLYYCKKYYNYNPFFKTIEDLCDKIESLHTHLELGCIASSEALRPDYSQILNI